MFKEHKVFTLTIFGETIEISEKVKEALETGKYLRVPSWAIDVFIRYDKSTDTWYSENYPDGIKPTKKSLEASKLLVDLQQLQHRYITPLTKKQEDALLEIQALTARVSDLRKILTNS